tara:strand:+ start:77 stop:517 length:441 start_codon:yes stop_codon:yes gene_type:complete
MRYGIERKTKLMTLDRETLKAIREKGNKALKAVGEELGVKIELGNCSYSESEATFQMKVNIISEDGEVITKEWENLLQLAKLKGFDVEKEYTLNGSKVKLKGYNSRARKWCYIVEYVVDGRVVRVGDQWFDKAVMDSSCKSGSCGC